MMNLASVDLNLLVALDALLAEAHVGRAARRIGRSQPAVSHALRRLRELLDDPLLVRIGSRMDLTPRALSLREALPDALDRVRTLLVGRLLVGLRFGGGLGPGNLAGQTFTTGRA